MTKRPKAAPSWCKWWMDDWRNSSLRKRLGTPAMRGLYRELWDFLMSCPQPGHGVDSAGNPYSISDIAQEIGGRHDHVTSMIGTAQELGRITIGSRYELVMNTIDTEKSLPDHWKYNRLQAKPSDSNQITHKKKTRLGRGRGRDRGSNNNNNSAADVDDSQDTRAEPNGVPYQQIVAAWNAVASQQPRLPQVQSVSTARKAHLRARWTEPMFRDSYAKLFERVGGSRFLRGESGRWRADFDWIIKNDENYAKVMEGKYDDRTDRTADAANPEAF